MANFVKNLNKLNIQSAFIVINKPFYRTILSVNGEMFVNFKWFFVDVRWTLHNNWMWFKINSMFLFGTVFTAFISSSLSHAIHELTKMCLFTAFFYSKEICQQTLNPGCLCIWKFLNWFDLMRKYAELCQCKAMQCTVFRHSHHFCNNRVTILIGPSNLYDTQCKQNKCITTVKKNQVDSEWFDVLSPYHTLWLVGQDRATAKIWLACNDSIFICTAAWMLIYWLTILNWVGPTW